MIIIILNITLLKLNYNITKYYYNFYSTKSYRITDQILTVNHKIFWHVMIECYPQDLDFNFMTLYSFLSIVTIYNSDLDRKATSHKRLVKPTGIGLHQTPLFTMQSSKSSARRHAHKGLQHPHPGGWSYLHVSQLIALKQEIP